ncbi:transcriptional repressor LexA [Bermanella sp. WJH001]|uniref:transcriptional repressor LexA n=1 Tax=Bermanella sp. WJH001 TaxID=3048005 RepID=UPI0024BD8EB2|nr:transcriptional repressor LexA [Bermanella sp. WJH001]MDJ1537241.1 transcriptional repressor LexA [Bermanella sp. WJH001]
MIKLTARQQEVLNLIKHSIETTGFPPTRAEIAKELGFKSPNAAEEHLKALARKGAIEMTPGASRGIRLAEDQSGIPLIGRVAAGEPILAQEHVERYVELPREFFKPSADFLLEVHGESMKDIGIMDGDLIAVHKTNQARNGQIVVARVGEEVTVKRFQQDKNIVKLLPENQEFAPIVVDLQTEPLEIEGLYVGIIRQHLH